MVLNMADTKQLRKTALSALEKKRFFTFILSNAHIISIMHGSSGPCTGGLSNAIPGLICGLRDTLPKLSTSIQTEQI